jgi:acylphosphatase
LIVPAISGGEVFFLPGTQICGTLLPASAVKRARMQIFYSGRVQGVGFRYTVKQVVSGFEATGIVRNLPDGRVELVAEGRREELNAFREAIRESGLESFIQNEEVIWGEPANSFRGFEIVG